MAAAPAHVLIVEDSALVVGALRLLLEEAGFRISAAHTVSEALTTARAGRPDLMLLDLTLPDGDGLAVLGALRASGAAPRVTVALTGRDEPETHARCLAAGCRAVLVKPIAPLALAGQLRGWLDEGRGTRDVG